MVRPRTSFEPASSSSSSNWLLSENGWDFGSNVKRPKTTK